MHMQLLGHAAHHPPPASPLPPLASLSGSLVARPIQRSIRCDYCFCAVNRPLVARLSSPCPCVASREHLGTSTSGSPSAPGLRLVNKRPVRPIYTSTFLSLSTVQPAAGPTDALVIAPASRPSPLWLACSLPRLRADIPPPQLYIHSRCLDCTLSARYKLYIHIQLPDNAFGKGEPRLITNPREMSIHDGACRLNFRELYL